MLDGALALALPAKFGQNLRVEPNKDNMLIWKSYTGSKLCWFEATFEAHSLTILKTTSKEIAKTLQSLLLKAKQLNPNLDLGVSVTTALEFPRNWGLGTSSTLINNMAQWANVDAYELLKTFGGSGYDIACAQNNKPLFYQLVNGEAIVSNAAFNPSFNDELYFVYLNKKQNSKTGIKQYRQTKKDLIVINDISAISRELAKVEKLQDFAYLLKNHEQLIGKIIKESPIQETLFKDYFGQTKSLGAWGGDFILATGNADTPHYFKSKGFETCIKYQDLVL